MTRAGKAAAVDLEIRHGGKRYIISPLEEADWSELEYWMQERTLGAELALIKKLPEKYAELREQKTSEAYDRSRQIIVGGSAAAHIMLSVNGAIRVAWMALRRKNDLTIDDVAALCNDPAFQEKLKQKIDSMNSADPEDVKAAKKKATREAARRKNLSKRKRKSR